MELIAIGLTQKKYEFDPLTQTCTKSYLIWKEEMPFKDIKIYHKREFVYRDTGPANKSGTLSQLRLRYKGKSQILVESIYKTPVLKMYEKVNKIINPSQEVNNY